MSRFNKFVDERVGFFLDLFHTTYAYSFTLLYRFIRLCDDLTHSIAVSNILKFEVSMITALLLRLNSFHPLDLYFKVEVH